MLKLNKLNLKGAAFSILFYFRAVGVTINTFYGPGTFTTI